jgi:hypothetical protein
MSIGPVELIVLKYRGDRFTGVPAESIRQLVDRDMLRVIDVVFAKKREKDVQVLELEDLEEEEANRIGPVVSDINGLIKPDDVKAITASWEPGTSGAVILLENTWAGRFADDVKAGGGEVVLAERIPRAVVEEVLRGGSLEDEAQPARQPANG